MTNGTNHIVEHVFADMTLLSIPLVSQADKPWGSTLREELQPTRVLESLISFPGTVAGEQVSL
jgi:hypothetical protein